MSALYEARKARRYADLSQRSALAAAEFRSHADAMSQSESEIVRGEALRLYRLAAEYERDSADSMTVALECGWHEGLAQ